MKLQRIRYPVLAIATLGVMLAGVVLTFSLAHAAPNKTASTHTASAQLNGKQNVAYFTEWGIYSRGYNVKNVLTSGAAGELTAINYAFANIDSSNHCAIGDAYADYQKTFTADQAVNGTADTWNQTLAGNFNQLRELKALNPNLKVLISIGGWTWSTNFSSAASSANVNGFVNSCLDLFIKGNLPNLPGAASGLFDGIDIDWEYPNDVGNNNPHGPQDIQNYTNLLSTFRSQLDSYGQTTGKHYTLSVAAPAGQDKFTRLQLSQVAQSTDYIDLMAYDMHGAWNANGPTDFNAPLYNDPADPSAPPANTYSVDTAVRGYLGAGVPASKLVIGVPFYGRGWTNVPNNNNGLFQSSASMQPAPSSNQAGVEDFRNLENLTQSGYTMYHDNAAQASWIFNGSTFWSYDDPATIQTKTNYIKNNGLGGAMTWSLDGDDSNGTLMRALYQDLGGTSGGPTPTPSAPTPTTVPPTPTHVPPTATPVTNPTATPVTNPTATPVTNPTATPVSGGGNLVTNSGFETGTLSGWTCDAGNTVVGNPVHGGSHALQLTPTASTTGQCTQTISVQPNHTYTLSAYVNGPYAYLGVNGGASNWTSSSSYTLLNTTVTTDATTTSVTIYVHGWYGQGNVFVDDVSLK